MYRMLLFMFLIPAMVVSQPTINLSKGDLIEGFDNIWEWTLGGISSYYSEDVINHTEGSSSLMLGTAIANMKSSVTKNIFIDFSNYETFSIDVYTPEFPKRIINFRIELSHKNVDSASLRAGITAGMRISKGWNRIVFDKADFCRICSYGKWSDPMRQMRLTVWTDNDTSSLTFDNFRGYYKKSTPIALITFDDGLLTQKTLAKPIMDSLGLKATLFVNGRSSNSANKNYLHWADLDSLYWDGWDICNHSYSHLSLLNFSSNALDFEINGMRDTLIKHGYLRSSDYFSYPYGDYDSLIIAKVREKNKLARSSRDWQYLSHPTGVGDDYYLLREHNEAVSYLEHCNDIDRVIERGQLLVYLFHDISSYTGKFSGIMHYLKAKQDSGLIKVMTMSQYAEALHQTATAGDLKSNAAFKFNLLQNYPNPFNPKTVIDYELEADDNINLSIYNILGQEVDTLFNGFQRAGVYHAGFDASKLPSGVYLYKLQSGKNIIAKKMVLLR